MSLAVFVIAIILGTLTVFLARSYINQQRLDAAAVVTTADDGQEIGTMVVAAGPLNFGDEITVESLREIPFPIDPENRIEGSFSKVSEVLDGKRRVVIRSIAKTEPVVRNKISGFGYRATLSQVVDPTLRAVAIRVNDVTGVGGFVLPGDRVDVVFTMRDRQNLEKSESILIIRDVRVLAIDQVADESTDGAVVAKAATLEVSQEQAQKLSLASRLGELDLSLRPMTANGEVLDDDSSTIRIADLINDNRASFEPKPELTKTVRRRRTVRVKAPKPDPFATMIITRGTTSSENEVPKGENSNTGNTLAGQSPNSSLQTNQSQMGYPNR